MLGYQPFKIRELKFEIDRFAETIAVCGIDFWRALAQRSVIGLAQRGVASMFSPAHRGQPLQAQGATEVT